MIRNIADIHVLSFDQLFAKYKVRKDDLEKYRILLSAGKEAEVVDHFVEYYIRPPLDLYYKHLNTYLIEAEKGELDKKSRRNLLKMVPLLSFGVAALINKNFRSFIEKALGFSIFQSRGITETKVQDAILEATLGQFETLTLGALTNTQASVLKNIRNMQKEMIVFNQTLGGLSGRDLEIRTQAFLRRIKRMFPEYEKLKDGKFVAYGVGDKIRNYKLDTYLEMSTRTTLLNIDRTAVQISVLNKEAEKAKKRGRQAVNVVEYIKISNRPLRTGIEREICKSILSNKKHGASLLALDDKTASILGIRTVDEVRSTPDYAMGSWCRHGLKPVSVKMRSQLEEKINKYYEGGI
jgi:hypothetical protein